MLLQTTRASRLPFFAPVAAAKAPSSGQPALPSETLKRGDRGTSVQNVQLALVKLGELSREKYQTGPGTFGPATEAGVKSFQQKWGLKADGVYTASTRTAMEKALRGEKPLPPPPVDVKKPAVVWAPSPNHDDRNGTDIDAIVLHHTASNNGKSDVAYLRNPSSKVSAHYVVDQDGKIYQLVADGRRAWHAGKSELNGKPDVNSRSIGIEIVNAGDGKTPFTEAQYKALEQLVPYLAQTYKVPRENLVGHKDIAIPHGRKSDPAPNFDMTRIRKAMAKVV